LKKKVIVGISGASGASLAIHCLDILKQANVEIHLIITKPAQMTIAYETDCKLDDVKAKADFIHNNTDIGASCASGTFKSDGMIIVPCSMKTLGEVACGICGNLLTRSADVILKERRKLVMVVRETPFNLSHIRNMETITLMGGIIYPPVPAFYTNPKTIDELNYQISARSVESLDLGIDIPNIKRWKQDD
jgi:4-hydroxy-3-polyprenylbenzoate decarboxylase